MTTTTEQQPVTTTDRVFVSAAAFMGKIQGIPYISQGLQELGASPTAIVYSNGPCCSCRCVLPCHCNCDCGDNYTYNTLVINNGETKYLYKNLARLGCTLCASGPMGRFSFIKCLNLSSYDEIAAGLGVESAETTKESGCQCCGCCAAYFPVKTKPDERLVGLVRYSGCCTDCCKGSGKCCDCCKDCCFTHLYCCDILAIDKNPIYTIFIRRCCISCCPLDCCNVINFIIKDLAGNEVGKIELRRNCCTCGGLCGQNHTYSIDFPLNATPELKDIRNSIRKLEVKLQDKIATLAFSYSQYLNDENSTIRDGHFVLPVKTVDKSKVLGIVYDVSDSGATTFIEPMEIVQINNQLTALKVEENDEVRRILKGLTALVLLQ